MTKGHSAISLAGAGALVLVGCGGLGTIRYEGDLAKQRGLAKGDVAVYVLDCADGDALVCSYQGQPLPWRVVGYFRVPPKAMSKWERYVDKVRERAAEVGCAAVGVRRVPPPKRAEEPIGAMCLDVAAAAAPAATVPAELTSPSPTPGAPAAQRCHSDGDCGRGQQCLHDVCR